MTIVFKQSTYRIPGIYQWVKPNVAAGTGPFGSTYLQTIITVTGPGSGGGSGNVANNVNTVDTGGFGGLGGGYGQATYLPAALPVLADVVVGGGSPGALPASVSGSIPAQSSGLNSLGTVTSSFGSLMSSLGGGPSNVGNSGTVSIIGGTNITSVQGGFHNPLLNNVADQLPVGPGILSSSINTWNTQGNNAGANGGSANILVPPPPFGGNGGGVNFGGGGAGSTNSNSPAGKGQVPGAGGGASGAFLNGLGSLFGGNGADGKPNTGAGGGGGGGAQNILNSASGVITSGAGGRGADGLVRITDIFVFPPSPPPYYFNFDKVTWYHMMNQARPISLTGRYQS